MTDFCSYRRRWCAGILTVTLTVCGLGGCVESKPADTTAPASQPTQEPVEEWTAPVYETFETPLAVWCGDSRLVADVVATNEPYGADPSGKRDSTAAINRALSACTPGGTVWLPAGHYLITGTLQVPAFVTLAGEWRDPDLNDGYGAVLLAKVRSADAVLPALISLAGSAGARGLTVYYPDQSLTAVKPYPFTFYVGGSATADGYMLQSVIDCAVINGYRGLGACVSGTPVHEMMTVENFKGTFLYCGAEAYNQADVGTWREVTVSPRYWAQATEGLAGAPEAEIAAYTRAHATGLILGDLEWTQFSEVDIAECRTGVRIVKGKRIEFAGSFFGLRVARCDVAFDAEEIDTRWGALIAASSLEGSDHALINRTDGIVKLVGVTLSGKTQGKVDSIDAKADVSGFLLRRVPAQKAEGALLVGRLSSSGRADVSAALQELLDAAAQAGGGTVYLPAGRYLLSRPVTVPAGVELRGSSDVAVRGQSGASRGTVLLADYGYDAGDWRTADALITLAGDGAALCGMTIFYPGNNPAEGTCRPCAFSVRAKGSGVRMENLCLAAAYAGIEVENGDGFVIKKVTTGCYRLVFSVRGGSEGLIEGCLQNGTVIMRHGLQAFCSAWPDESRVFELVFDPITRVNCEYLRAQDTDALLVSNCFAYGVHSLMVSRDSRLTVIGVGADNLGGPLLDQDGGEVKALNVMRWNGSSYVRRSGQLTLLNRLTINDKTERAVYE